MYNSRGTPIDLAGMYLGRDSPCIVSYQEVLEDRCSCIPGNYIYANDNFMLKAQTPEHPIHKGRQCSSSCQACSQNQQLILGGSIEDPAQVANNVAQKQMETDYIGLKMDNSITQASLEKRDMLNFGFILNDIIAEGEYSRVYDGQVKSYASLPNKSQLLNYMSKQCIVKAICKDLAASDFAVDKETASRFISKELAITQSAQGHRHIVKYIENHETLSHFYLFIEKCKCDLKSHILKTGKLKEDEARMIFNEILSGVKHLHRKGIVHRDLKCENILLDFSNCVKISDFGLAAITPNKRSKLLSTGCGSLSYAAPELLNAEKYDGKLVDIWAVGVIVYAMVNGCTPWLCEKKDILLADMNMQRIRFSKCSPEFRLLVRGILQWDPLKRHTLTEMQQHPWTCGQKLKPGERLHPGKVKSAKKETSETELRLPTPRSLYSQVCNNMNYSTVSFQQGKSNITLKSRVPDHTKTKYLIGLETPTAIRKQLQDALNSHRSNDGAGTRLSDVIGTLVTSAKEFDDQPNNNNSLNLDVSVQSRLDGCSSAPCCQLLTTDETRQLKKSQSHENKQKVKKWNHEKEAMGKDGMIANVQDEVFNEDFAGANRTSVEHLIIRRAAEMLFKGAQNTKTKTLDVVEGKDQVENDTVADKMTCIGTNIYGEKDAAGGEQVSEGLMAIDEADADVNAAHHDVVEDNEHIGNTLDRDTEGGNIAYSQNADGDESKQVNNFEVFEDKMSEQSECLTVKTLVLQDPNQKDHAIDLAIERLYESNRPRYLVPTLESMKKLDPPKSKVKHYRMDCPKQKLKNVVHHDIVTKFLTEDGSLSLKPRRQTSNKGSDFILPRNGQADSAEKSVSDTSGTSSRNVEYQKLSPAIPVQCDRPLWKKFGDEAKVKTPLLPSILTPYNVRMGAISNTPIFEARPPPRYAVTVKGVLVGVDSVEPQTAPLTADVYRLPPSRRNLRARKKQLAASVHKIPQLKKNETLVGVPMTRFKCLPGAYHGSDVYVAANRVDGPTTWFDAKGRRMCTPIRNKQLKNVNSLVSDPMKACSLEEMRNLQSIADSVPPQPLPSPDRLIIDHEMRAIDNYPLEPLVRE